MENKIINKIFGYSKTGGKHWFNSAAYNDQEIEEIKDPEGGSEISLPTAIPSPFARIDLTKTAFGNINKTPWLKAHTQDDTVLASSSDEKLVSDCFDVAEMLFNYNNVRDMIEILVWDRKTELTKLKSGSDEHRRFAETLELYLDQDKDAYNFDLLHKLYLIKYNKKTIGCTSPVTLFFASGNNLKKAQIQLTGSDILFDENYVPLYERKDLEFQKYFHLMFKAHPILSKRMTVFAEYLRRNKEILEERNPAFHAELENLKKEDYKKLYAELNAGTANSEIEVLGAGLRKRKSEDVTKFISDKSDFRIVSEKIPKEDRPLVLQKDFAKGDWLYAKDNWTKIENFPFTREILGKRNLPGINVLYPYLTVSDFLEPYLIRLVYPINKDKFFDGNLKIEIGDDSKGYILPLKRQFFDYFDSEDLSGSSAHKPSIKMIQGAANSVKVILKIPVAKPDEYMTFERKYFESSVSQLSKPDEENNTGVIVEHQFGITLFPFLKTNDSKIKSFYRVQLIDRDIAGSFKDNDYSLEFYSNQSPDRLKIAGEKPRIRSIKGVNGSDATSKYFVFNDEFDFIQVKSTYASGIIIPKWQPFHQGQQEFSFAVDFGTTNTHIEYKVGNPIQPFDIIKSNELQIATLFDPEKISADVGGTSASAIRDLVEHEFIPHQIGKDSSNSKYIYKFPQRTIISESNTLDIRTQPLTLADFNIPFTYEKKTEIGKIESNLKWAKKGEGNEERVKAFFEEIIMLLRNKVLMNQGNLSKTKLFWFYPSSMTAGRMGTLQNEWNKLFKEYFNISGGTTGITESMAPFFYFKGEFLLEGGGSFKPVISIDIGGGTTDIVVFKEDKPILLTSFKFAANSIFGDGFSEYGTNSNGLVNKYYPRIKALLEKNDLRELSDVLSTIKEKSKNEDINAFFFSIEDNPKIISKDSFSYNLMLARDENLKIIFLYFYSAIIYHIAALMHNEKIELPKNLTFSGTGSKILGIITTDLDILADLSRKIFEAVYGEPFKEGLSIKTRDNPKEVTCKGGLMANSDELKTIKVSKIKSVLTCLRNNSEKLDDSSKNTDRLNNLPKLSEVSSNKKELKYMDLNDSVKEEITTYIGDFNSFFMELNSQFRFTEFFNITENSLRIFKEEFNKDLRDYLETGLQFAKKLDDVTDEDTKIGETLFFYPIIGTINRVTRILSEQQD